eukprot:g4266.t1
MDTSLESLLGSTSHGNGLSDEMRARIFGETSTQATDTVRTAIDHARAPLSHSYDYGSRGLTLENRPDLQALLMEKDELESKRKELLAERNKRVKELEQAGLMTSTNSLQQASTLSTKSSVMKRRRRAAARRRKRLAMLESRFGKKMIGAVDKHRSGRKRTQKELLEHLAPRWAKPAPAVSVAGPKKDHHQEKRSNIIDNSNTRRNRRNQKLSRHGVNDNQYHQQEYSRTTGGGILGFGTRSISPIQSPRKNIGTTSTGVPNRAGILSADSKGRGGLMRKQLPPRSLPKMEPRKFAWLSETEHEEGTSISTKAHTSTMRKKRGKKQPSNAMSIPSDIPAPSQFSSLDEEQNHLMQLLATFAKEKEKLQADIRNSTQSVVRLKDEISTNREEVAKQLVRLQAEVDEGEEDVSDDDDSESKNTNEDNDEDEDFGGSFFLTSLNIDNEPKRKPAPPKQNSLRAQYNAMKKKKEEKQVAMKAKEVTEKDNKSSIEAIRVRAKIKARQRLKALEARNLKTKKSGTSTATSMMKEKKLQSKRHHSSRTQLNRSLKRSGMPKGRRHHHHRVDGDSESYTTYSKRSMQQMSSNVRDLAAKLEPRVFKKRSTMVPHTKVHRRRHRNKGTISESDVKKERTRRGDRQSRRNRATRVSKRTSSEKQIQRVKRRSRSSTRSRSRNRNSRKGGRSERLANISTGNIMSKSTSSLRYLKELQAPVQKQERYERWTSKSTNSRTIPRTTGSKRSRVKKRYDQFYADRIKLLLE